MLDSFRVRLGLPLLLLLSACAPAIQSAGPGADGPRLASGAFVTRDGLRLPLQVWRPDGDPAAVALALHGFNDYREAFADPARVLTARDILVYAYDQRGFGEAPHRGLWPGVSRLVTDARDATRLLASRHPDLPLYLIGESMGAAVALVAAAGDHRSAGTDDLAPPMGEPLPIAGLVLLAPPAWARAEMPALYRSVLATLSHLIPWYPLTGQGLKIRASDNIEMLRRLAGDPNVLKEARVDTIRGLVDLMDAAFSAAPHLSTPTLILYGLRDEIVRPEPTRTFVARLPPHARAEWRLAIYPEGYHLLTRDLAGDRVSADIAAWMRDPHRPLPSGAERDAAMRLAGKPPPPPTMEALARP